MYTEAESLQLHYHFYYLKIERVFSLMKRDGDVNASSETYARLEEISNEYDICLFFAEQPGRFRVFIPNVGFDLIEPS